jgi:hypothetical protein
MEVFMAFTDSQTFAAIVGGLIGIIPTFGFSIFYDRCKKKKEERETYFAWINGLSAELNHLKNCTTEIRGYLDTNQIPTKRLNDDFIEKARLVLFSYNKDIHFLESLTTCYRDVVHTNEMLNRLERIFLETNTTNLPFSRNVISSIDGVNRSISALGVNISSEIKKL